MSACSRCGATIVWETTAKNGKKIPLDAEPTPTGNVVIRNDLAVVLNLQARDEAIQQGEAIWESHFATCPERSRPRNGGSSTAGTATAAAPVRMQSRDPALRWQAEDRERVTSMQMLERIVSLEKAVEDLQRYVVGLGDTVEQLAEEVFE